MSVTSAVFDTLSREQLIRYVTELVQQLDQATRPHSTAPATLPSGWTSTDETYRRLYDQAPTMYFTLALDGTVMSVNPYGATYLGYTVDELVGRPVFLGQGKHPPHDLGK